MIMTINHTPEEVAPSISVLTWIFCVSILVMPNLTVIEKLHWNWNAFRYLNLHQKRRRKSTIYFESKKKRKINENARKCNLNYFLPRGIFLR